MWALAAVVLIRPPRIAEHYNSLVLFVSFWVYVYRDIWPLATYSEVPKDADEGLLLWAKIAVLLITAVVIPLFVPNIYVPVDPKVRRSVSQVTRLFLTPVCRIPCLYQMLSKPALCSTHSSLTGILALLYAWPVKWIIWTQRSCLHFAIATPPNISSKSHFP